jgi:FkbM family methyltransferase
MAVDEPNASDTGGAGAADATVPRWTPAPPPSLPPLQPASAATPAAAPKRRPPPAAPSELLVRKLELERAMHAAPGDAALRVAYFEQLGRIAGGHTGLQTALLPELGAPLYFRAGTPDIAVLLGVFRDNAMAFTLRFPPLRILVLGAYVGYTAIDLARRFPRADILAVEPLADNYRLLMLNTAMCPRIARRHVAVWHSPTRLAPSHRFQADWAVRLHDQDYAEERTIPACSVPQLLDEVGWPGAELVVCDLSGGEREVFANPAAPWLQQVDAALVMLHEAAAPRATEWVDKALDEAAFAHHKLGAMDLYLRREPRHRPPPAPPPLHVIRSEPGLARFGVADVAAAAFGFFVFGGSNCQVHPNPPGAPPARALFAVEADGHTRFESGLRHFGPNAPPIVFTAAVHRLDGSLAGHGEATLQERQIGDLRFAFDAPLTGQVRVMLQTAMAPEAETAAMALAHWLAPRLL